MGTWLSPAPMAMPSNAVQAGGFQILHKRLGPLQPWRRSGCFRGGEARFGNGANRIPVGNRRELDEIEHSGRVQVVELLRDRGVGGVTGSECLRLSTPTATKAMDWRISEA
jgi:hypothetical protein